MGHVNVPGYDSCLAESAWRALAGVIVDDGYDARKIHVKCCGGKKRGICKLPRCFLWQCPLNLNKNSKGESDLISFPIQIPLTQQFLPMDHEKLCSNLKAGHYLQGPK
eukprot:644863-Pelagomonas_calceolata.AAC.2